MVGKGFGKPPTINQKACGLINTFYNLILTRKEKFLNSDLLTPESSILDLIKQAEEEGFDIELSINPIKGE